MTRAAPQAHGPDEARHDRAAAAPAQPEGLATSTGEEAPWAPPRWLGELVVLAIATVAALGSVAVAAAQRDEGMELNAVSVLLLGLAVAALPFRHRYPATVMAVTFVTTLAYTAFYAEGPVFVPMVVALGQLVLVGRRRAAVVTLVAGWALFSWFEVVSGDSEAPPVANVVALGAWLAFLFTLTEVIRARRDRAREAQRSQAEAMRRYATEERLRIARELHDVVAHNMSLINLQAGVALHLIDQQPEQARESLSTIKDASKEALVELRSILGVLRQVDEPAPAQGRTGGVDGAADGSETEAGRRVLGGADEVGAPRAPVPSLRRLGALLVRSRAAGLDVTVDDDVNVGFAEFSRDVDLAAYRIIQESLTNVARHADNPSATVRLRVEEGVLSIAVLDEGSSPPSEEAMSSGGHGLSGMRERAASVGGRFEVGPRPGRGFAVRAWLPIGGRAQAGER